MDRQDQVARQDQADGKNTHPRIVSLDFCADQYVLKLAPRAHIAGLSPDADAAFSYMREQAHGIRKIRPRAEDILLQKPDIVVRSYGGGPNATAFFERAGVKVVQIGFASDLDAVETIIRDTARALDAEERGQALIAQMHARLAALPRISAPGAHKKSLLYMTSKGAAAGRNTLIDDLIMRAGYDNFQRASGWGVLPLERLAYKAPDVIATGFFDTADLATDRWTAARHKVARRRLARQSVIDIPGAWTACSGWFLIDAVEAMAAGAAP